ncbi:DJ-1/PfpI family protein [Hwanghaeella sp.]|uniref:DJ-1/PfpI family protein n=1 Tax=Hwanghaeella sp. TaxID=2605943 RepID=UPI003CCBBF27
MYGILIYDGVEPVDIGATVGVLSMARRIAPELHYVTVAKSAGEITCANGLKVVADHGLDDAPALTDLIVTGGPGWSDAAKDQKILEFLRMTNVRLTSICTGAMILAAAGRLAGKTVTTKHEVFPGEMPPSELLEECRDVRRATLVDDHGIVTGGGVTLGFDTMFFCLARSHGEEVAHETARVMEYSRALAANRLDLGYHTVNSAETASAA